MAGYWPGEGPRPPQTPPRLLLESWLLLEVGCASVAFSTVYWNDSVLSASSHTYLPFHVAVSDGQAKVMGWP